MAYKRANALPSVVISLFVINENEFSAASSMLEAANWQTTGCDIVGGLPRARFAYRGVRYTKTVGTGQIVRLDLVHQDVSSNLPMGLSTLRYFDYLEDDLQKTYKNSVFPVRYAILYGCAGAIPKESKETAVSLDTDASEKVSRSGIHYHAPVGDVVVVEEATWVENGEWVTEEREDSTLIDIQHSKVEKYGQFRAECPPDLRNRIQVGLALHRASVLCVDKVVKLKNLRKDDDTTVPNHQSDRPTLRELLRRNYDIVDMESYGFLVSVPGDLRNVLVLRVLTDTLGSKADSNSDVLQHDLLAEHAGTTLLKVLESIIDGIAQKTRPAEDVDAEAVSGVLLQLALQSARLTQNDRKMRSHELDEVTSVASMRLADLSFEDSSNADGADLAERRLFEAASLIVRTAKLGYATRRFRDFADDDVFAFLQERSPEIDFEYAYKGWRAFCEQIVPTNISANYRRYSASANGALEHAFEVLGGSFVSRRPIETKNGSATPNKRDWLTFSAQILGAGSDVPYGVVVLSSDESEAALMNGALWGVDDEAAVMRVSWNGFEDDECLIEALRRLIGY